ncbi:MAG: hypothetical protein ACMUIA_10170, partial [bacterium]
MRVPKKVLGILVVLLTCLAFLITTPNSARAYYGLGGLGMYGLGGLGMYGLGGLGMYGLGGLGMYGGLYGG